MLATIKRASPEHRQVAIMNRDVAKWLIAENLQFRNEFRFSDKKVDTAPLQFQFYKSPRLDRLVKQINDELLKMGVGDLKTN